MTIIVKIPHVSVEAQAEMYERFRGWAWRAAIIDSRSREELEHIDMQGDRWELRSDAANDAEDKLSGRLRKIQSERDAARKPQEKRA